MNITVENFGGFSKPKTYQLSNLTLPNGAGKTTLINAYIFALTGKTINGFVARNVNAKSNELTSVTLDGFLNLTLRRTTKGAGTTLYNDDNVITQVEFEQALAGMEYDMDFITTCANANVLTSNDLTTDALRKILSKADVIDTEDYDKIKKQQTIVRRQLKVAEQNAKTSVVVPAQMCPPLTQSERIFSDGYKKAKHIVENGVKFTCQYCGQKYNEVTLDKLTKEFNDAEIVVKNGAEENKRIEAKREAFILENEKINQAKGVIAASKRAREDMIRLSNELNDLTLELSKLDNDLIKSHLPEDVDVITEVIQKNGNTKPTCTIEYKGVPLRSINHAKRIEICVNILDSARKSKNMQLIPIIVDNAEAVEHDFPDVNNIMLFRVG